MRAALPAVACVALLLAGCTAPAQPVAPAAQPPAPVVDPDRPDTSFGAVATGPAASADDQATLERPPVLQAGEWRRIEATPIGSSMVEYVRVVAAVQEGKYVMGMPHEGWFKEAVAYHSPAFGDVDPDLSYLTHDERFAPLQFPLTEGLSWDTSFAMMPLTASVHVLDDHTAEITFRSPPSSPSPTDPVMNALMGGGDGEAFKLTYDARQHEVVKFASPVVTYEVKEHGYGFQGWVTVPRGEATPIDDGVVFPAVPVSKSLSVAGGFNRMTLMHFVGGLPGVYRVRTLAPDGTEHLTEAMADSSGLVLKFYEVANPDGDWTLEMLAGGVGGGYAMGIAYHQYDIHLPDGGIRSDHSHKVIR